MESKSYWPAGDIIRILGILGVMFVHITEQTLRNAPQLDTQWWLLNITHSFSIWAVPSFIMLSGALLLRDQTSEASSLRFYQKRLNRIGLPFLFWVAVYIPFQKWYNSLSFAYQGKEFLYGDVSEHLYFLFVIVGLYAITPWLQFWLNQASPQQQLVLCIILFILVATSELLREFLIPWRWNALMRWVPYIGYYIAGHYIVHYALDKIVVFFVFSFVGLLTTTGGKYLEMIWNPDGITYFYSTSYFSVAIIPLAIGIFGLIACLTKSISEDSKLVRISQFLAPSTLGIYLVHVLVFRGVHKLFSIQFPNNLITAFEHEIGVGLASLFLVYVIGLIPLLRYVVSYHTQKSLSNYFLKP